MKKISRRNFIGTSAAGVTGAILAPTILNSCKSEVSVSDRLLIAHIGVGSRGLHEMKRYFVPLETSYSVATCDPFKERRDASSKYISEQYKERGLKAPKVQAYLHFEEILERDDIDAVHITTPDHWHVPLAIHAARAGKHIMLAKPLGLSYPNFKILEEELKKNDLRFHYATQQRSMEHIKVAIELIKEGALGEIESVDVWAPGPAGKSPMCSKTSVPKGFDFDLWSGPAPLNPYCPERVTNVGSWFQYDYSIGFLGGWGAHPLDVMIWGLKEQMSGKYTCEGTGEFWEPGGIYDNIQKWDLNYEYESGIKMHFFSTDVAEKKDLLHYRNIKENNGTTFYGSKGWISIGRKSVESNIPDLNTKLNELSKSDKQFGQMFVDVVKGKIPETNPLDEAILSDTISHMGDMCIRSGRKITWDPNEGKVVDYAAANQWFRRDMREPYNI